MRDMRTAFGALVLAAAIAACAGAADGPEQSPTPSAGPESAAPATPTPAPSTSVVPGPSTAPHPALEDLVLTTGSLGPLVVGDVPLEMNPGAVMIAFDPDACPGDAEPGRWVAAGYEADVGYTGDPVDPPFRLAGTEAGIRRIDVLGQGPATAEGVRIGTSLTELRATYPDLEGPVAGPVSQVWLLRGADGTLAFETQGDADGLRPAGTAESVILIRVLAPGEPAEFATANSGDVADACSS